MTQRSYSSLIVLETLFDSIPNTNIDLNTFVNTIFTPHVSVTETNCGTAVGEMTDVNYELEGKVELSTGLVVSKARIEQLLGQGIYQVPVRTLSTCVAKNGVCQACYHSSRQYDPVPTLNGSVQVFPEYTVWTDATDVLVGTTQIPLSQPLDMYDRLYVYYEGTLLDPSTYTATDTLLTFSSSLPRDGQVVTRYTTITRAPFMAWLADTYAGGLLGLKSLPYPKLPVRKSLLAGLVPESMVELLGNQAAGLKGVPAECIEYLDNIRDPLEKALFIISLFAVYLNVS